MSGGAPLQRVAVDIELELDDDGGTEQVSVVLRPATLVATERHFKGTPPAIEGTLFAAWHQLHRGRRDAPTFADWLERVVAVEERPAVPTPATQAEQSPPSQ